MTMTSGPLFRDESSFRALHAQRMYSYQLADHRVDSAREPSLGVADILRLGIFPRAYSRTHLLAEEPKACIAIRDRRRHNARHAPFPSSHFPNFLRAPLRCRVELS